MSAVENSAALPDPPPDPPPNSRHRRFDSEARAELEATSGHQRLAPTWRGWAIGLLAVAVLSLIIPYVDYILRGTRLTLNLMPAGSVFLILALTLSFNLLLARWRASLALSRQDLTLIFCMTFVINPLPGGGMMSYWAAELLGPQQFATEGNQWKELLVQRIPAELAPRDPADPASSGARPVQWLYSGLPEGQAIPWAALAGPYARWFVAMALVLGLFLAACLLLRQQWADHEKLPFPMTQVPLEMMEGLPPDTKQKPFLFDRVALFGILTTFLLHSYNALGDYVPLIEQLPLHNTGFDAKYLTEGAFARALHPVRFSLYPSIIGITFLISTEVSFSLWFFYWVKKLLIVALVLWFGLGASEWSFTSSEGWQGLFVNQGVGALIAMVLVGLYLARKPLWGSLRQAWNGKEGAYDAEVEGFSARAVWALLGICAAGSAAWLMLYMGVSWGWALLAVALLLLFNIGVARLVSEAGLFYLEFNAHPGELLGSLFTPVGLGAQNFLMLNIWSRMMAFDYLRSSPAITFFQSVHLAGQSGTRRRSLVLGLVSAVLLCFVCSFFGFFQTLYHNPSGLTQTWTFDHFPNHEYTRLAGRVKAVERWNRRKHAPNAAAISAADVPKVAKVDRFRVYGLLIGAGLMVLFLFLRSRVFWWPHPIGIVMWAGPWPMLQMWFSYFLGWLCKVVIVKFGGFRVFQRCRRYFIGLIAGELLATVLWLAVAYATGTTGTYPMHLN